jgi:hypothetical protein
MILVHAGNRTDAADRDTAPRFPESNVPDVEHRVGRLLESLKPTWVVTAAAAGADLILLREALRRGVSVQVVLPLLEPEFIELGVADRDAHWLEMYRSLRTQIPDENIHITDLSDDEDWYLNGTGLILDAAQAIRPAQLVVALAIRPAKSEDPPSATDDFAQRAQDRGLPVIGIDPSILLADLERAFVIMPYGEKRDPRSGTWIDFDSIFERLIVPSLENASLNWRRAERSFDTGLVDDGMIEQIANADVVVADLTIDNPKVYDALRLRNVLATRMTVLLAREGTSAPFDISDIGDTRQFRYSLSGTTISYEEAFAAYAALQRVIVP